MKGIEVKVIYDSENNSLYQKKIADIFYQFGATGLKIEEPLQKKNPLDYYKDESSFLMINHAVSAYFPVNPYAKKRQEALLEAFEAALGEDEDVVYHIDVSEYEEEDYQNKWKQYLFPEKISKSFVVKPTWRDYELKEGEKMIVLDPGRAFGTGSHPTTSLCVSLMEKHLSPGEKVLDVGTGSGILMIVAEKLGASFVCGVDIDPLAVEVAEENLTLNGIGKGKYQLLEGNLLDKVEKESYDLVVANILADVLLVLLEDIFKVVKPGGKIILSGIIEEKAWEVEQKIESLGLRMEEKIEKGEWQAFCVRA